MAKDLLYEIGAEELPASYIQPALKQLRQVAETFLKEARLSYGEIHTAGTPRRLVLQIKSLAERQPDKQEEVQGPSAKAAFDAQGKATQVAEGFAKSRGVFLQNLKVRNTPKGDYVFALVEQKGKSTKELLEQWLPQVTRQLAFPKSMRWGQGGPLRFARPIQWLCALYGEQVLKLQLDFLQSAPKTWGHRFLKPGPFSLKKSSEYSAALQKGFVMLEQAEREAAIRHALHKACDGAGLVLIEDPELEAICANLVEWPEVLLGHFDRSYLQVPEEVIVCALREHQRYFAAREKSGKLAPVFLVVTNGTRKNLAGVRLGNERVLKARLEDAKFFFHEDQKTKLEAKLEELKHVVWMENFGSLNDKAKRLESLAGWLAEQVAPQEKAAAQRAALLCKCDLVTNVVGEKEFTSLQGTMGGIYARLSGEGAGVAQAISQHYKPAFAGDAIPGSMAGQLVSLADKFDNIVGCFAAGIVPSGSQDPYALRRQASGVIAILNSFPKDLSLEACLVESLRLWSGSTGRDLGRELLGGMKDLFRQRLETALGDQGYAFDLVAAALVRRSDLVREAQLRAKALSNLRNRPDFEEITQAFSRVTNILSKSEGPGNIDINLLGEGPEKVFYQAYEAALPNVEQLCDAGKFEEAFEALAKLKPSIDAYFDKVMVMDENPALRQNRLAFLTRVAGTLNRIADFTKLVKRS